MFKSIWYAGGPDLVQKENKQERDFARAFKDYAENFFVV